MNGAQEILKSRRTIYKFSDKQVDYSELELAFEVRLIMPLVTKKPTLGNTT